MNNFKFGEENKNKVTLKEKNSQDTTLEWRKLSGVIL